MLKNRLSVITGCSRGIGKEILITFARNKSNIIACFRSKNKKNLSLIEETKSKYKIKITPIFFDLSDEKKISKKLIPLIASSKVDILVNNAGILSSSLFQMTSISSMKNMFDVNFFSQMYITQLILKSMIKNKKGSIINISSTSGIDANIGRVSYAASKAALISATQVISKEVGPYNVRVNAIAPGVSKTDMYEKGHNEKIKKLILEKVSLKRVSEPKEIANVALFLASNLSSYLTGQVIRVDGGMQN